MNVIEIQNLINQIGDLKTSFNQQTQEYSLNELPVANINPNDNDALYGEYQIKLQTQLNQNSDVSLLNKLLLSVNRFEKELYEHYHYFRIKLSESSNSNKDLIKICKIIDLKLDCLFQMKTDLENTIRNFDFKLKTDFGGEVESQSKERTFEEDNLEEKKVNPYPNIFLNYDAFLFFERLIENICTDQSTQLADYSYVYRKMLEDKYINYEVSPSSFIAFLDKNYNIILDPLKSWGKLTGKHREKLYDILKTKSS